MIQKLKDFFLTGDRMIATLMTALFLLYYWEATTLAKTHFQDKVGPGTFPQILAIFGLCMVAIFFVDVLRGRTDTYEKSEGFIGEVKGIAILFMTIVYVFLLDLISYPIATFLFTAVVVKFLGERTWWVAALVGAILTSACYAFFVWFLDITFTTGDFWLMISGE